MQDFLLNLISLINAYLFDYVVVFLLILAGLWFSFQTRFVQVRCFVEGVRTVFKGMAFTGDRQRVGITQFRAFLNAIGAQIGAGNIIGAAGAILLGGPGAIFWMWIMAFFGMATMYAETVCAISTRKVESNGTIKGGAVYYILSAFKGRLGKFIAIFFAVAITIGSGFSNFMLQSNSIAETLSAVFEIPHFVTGIFLTMICGLILKGGLERVSGVIEKIVPIMSYLFIGGAIAVLVSKIQYLPEALYLIFYYAFEPQAILGGGFGEALKTAVNQGVRRGLFSNEAGMGSIVYAHAQANVNSPHSQGVVAMLGVFFDTFVILTLNALVIITVMYTSEGILANGYVGEVTETVNVSNLAPLAFGSVLDAGNFEGFGAQFVALCLLLFTFSTILVAYTIGKVNFVYLFGERYNRTYFALTLVILFIGALSKVDLVWEINDLANGLMVIPNVVALFALTSVVKNFSHPSKKVNLRKY